MKKTQLFKVASLMAITMLLLASCSKDEPKTQFEEDYIKYKEYYNALFNTSWKVEEWGEWRYQDGKWISKFDQLKTTLNRFCEDEMIITFKNKINANCYDLVFNLYPDAESRKWWIESPGEVECDDEYMKYPILTALCNGYINGEYRSVSPIYGPITEFTPNRLVLEFTHDNHSCRHRAVLTRMANPSQDNNQQSK